MKAIDEVIDALRDLLPAISIEQLKVKYPSDDDGLWFVNHPGANSEVNIESSTGEYPLLIETNDDSFTTHNLQETITAVVRGLGVAPPSQPNSSMFESGGVRAWVERETIHLMTNAPDTTDSTELSAADARRLADALLKMAGQLQH
jgi:hypothetical protein